MAKQLSFQIDDGGSIPTSPLQLFVKLINKETAANFYRRWHYLGDKGLIGMYHMGAYYDGAIQGAITWHIPYTEEVCKSIFGTTDQAGIFTLVRLAMTDDCPKNSESRFLAVATKLLRKMELVKAIVTYADTAQNHNGTIYRASNYTYLGLTPQKADFWVDGAIKYRGKSKGIEGEWIDRSRKHLFVKVFDSKLQITHKGTTIDNRLGGQK